MFPKIKRNQMRHIATETINVIFFYPELYNVNYTIHAIQVRQNLIWKHRSIRVDEAVHCFLHNYKIQDVLLSMHDHFRYGQQQNRGLF